MIHKKDVVLSLWSSYSHGETHTEQVERERESYQADQGSGPWPLIGVALSLVWPLITGLSHGIFGTMCGDSVEHWKWGQRGWGENRVLSQRLRETTRVDSWNQEINRTKVFSAYTKERFWSCCFLRCFSSYQPTCFMLSLSKGDDDDDDNHDKDEMSGTRFTDCFSCVKVSILNAWSNTVLLTTL